MEAESKDSGEYQCQKLQQAIAHQHRFRVQSYSFITTRGSIDLLFFHDALSLAMSQQESLLPFFSFMYYLYVPGFRLVVYTR